MDKYVISYVDSTGNTHYLISSGAQTYTANVGEATEFDHETAIALQNYITRVKKTEAQMSRVEKIYHKVQN
ncbi:hypothetical protein FDG95_gp553 [Pectobacterium phage vB_PcaM_CBB]|uniref:Uncharacterized protein n=1 Tax=Pectobacterium phage vB_PcaM_CBB TaxID=2772511 RepID=A0A1L2CVF9_9CAUD|nr:hypothetical protein FDG95_gp553 [Pectobacterium phage vB_PcaM_CBB]AMM43989.1 hypothetical protein CBB_426 [Pectobacterium phage vB_PcaM_CBB]